MRKKSTDVHAVLTTFEELVTNLQDACMDDTQVVSVLARMMNQGRLIWPENEISIHQSS